MSRKKEPAQSQQKRPSPQSKERSQEDESLLPGLRVVPQTGKPEKHPAHLAQQQEILTSLGKIGGNKALQQVIQTYGPPAIQRQDHAETTPSVPESGGPAPAAATAQASETMDAIVQEELEAFLDEFSNITVTLRWGEETDIATMQREEEIAFHPPYFMNVSEGSSPAARTQERYDNALAERGAAGRTIRNFIHDFSRSERRGGWGLGRALVGKSQPEDIRRIVQTALDRNLISAGTGRERPDSTDIRSWLQQYGIGVDCSAFVSQALNRAAARVLGRDLESDETLSRNSAGLAGNAAGFTPLDDPADLRPGDTMRIPGHIRIITRVQSDETSGVVFTTAESRAGGTLDVGPDRADWRFQGTTLQVRRGPSDEWSDTSEAPTFGRYDFLEAARTAAAAESAAGGATGSPSP